MSTPEDGTVCFLPIALDEAGCDEAELRRVFPEHEVTTDPNEVTCKRCLGEMRHA